MRRIVYDILLILSIFYMPFWFSAVLAVGGAWYFPAFYELPLAFFLIDIFYAIPERRFFSSLSVMTLIGAAIFFIIETLKKKFLYSK